MINTVFSVTFTTIVHLYYNCALLATLLHISEEIIRMINR